ncbi:MAG: hypothetical protein R2828_22155 [Saprospiraceae bacterium]
MLQATLKLVFCILIYGLSLLPTLEAQTSKDFVFINNTGRDANDLHIQFDTIVELVHPAPKETDRYLSSKFRRKTTQNDNGKTQIHLANRGRQEDKLVKNGEEVWGRFETNGEDLHIESWYWTFNGDTIGTVMAGDLNKANQAESLVVPGIDVVTGFKFKNDIYDGFNGPNQDAVVNDLHIVTNRPVIPINKTKADENDDEKVGGIFKGATTIHCECSQLPQAERERNRALNQMGEPCKSLCQDSREDLYVVQLDNPDEPLPAGTEIPINLRGDDTAEVLQWWFTGDGYPLKFRERRTESGRLRGEARRDGAVGEPLKLGDNDEDLGYGLGGDREGRGEIYSIATFNNPEVGKDNYALHLEGQFLYQELPEALNQGFLPQPEVIYESLFNEKNIELLEQLGDFKPLEGQLSTKNVTLPGLGLGLGISLSSKWQVAAGVSLSKGKIEGTIPIITFNSTSTAPIMATWEGKIQQTQFSLGFLYHFHPHLFAEVGGFWSTQKAVDSKLNLLSSELVVPTNWKTQNTGIKASMGMTVPIHPRFGFTIKGGINSLMKDQQYLIVPQAAAGIRIKLVD